VVIRDFDVLTGDGRSLRVREDGDPQGVPVVTNHGDPGGRTVPPAAVRFAQEHGIRLIRYDRPGFGGSTRAPGRRVVDAAGDVRAIVDALGVETFAVEGSSCGGPHALAIAALLADRVSAVAVSASVAPVDGPGLDFLDGIAADRLPSWRAAMEGPEANAPFVREATAWWLAQTPATLVDTVRAIGTDADVAAVDAETADYLVAHMREALRTGLDGYADEDHAVAHPWGFEPADVRCPTLVWHGEDDDIAPCAHGRWLAARIPGAEAHFAPGCGHMSCLAAEHIGFSLGWLLARSR
jgi:pimeloyl-ACP methyl ester carboxylesterase